MRLRRNKAKPAAAKSSKSEKSKPSFLRKLRPRIPKYFKESYAELRKVTWPTRREAWKLTLAVFIFSGVFTLFIVVVDNIFKFIAEELFL